MHIRQLRAWLVRLAGILGREARDRELAEELESHIQMHTEDNIRAGLSPEEARRQALIKLGGVEQTKEVFRRQRGVPMIEDLWQDLRYGARMFLKQPGFTLIAVLTLALGIGANTAIFSVMNAILLRSLPYKDPDRLLMLWENNPQVQMGIDEIPVTAANFVDWRDQNHVFADISILNSAQFALTGLDRPERVGGAAVSESFFRLMGVEPIMGRAFLPGEDAPGNNRVVIISHAMWRNRFGADPGIIGRTMALDGASYTIVGVMPSGFQFPRASEMPYYFHLPPQTELWTPIGLTDEQIRNRGNHSYVVIARVKPGVTLAEAQANMDTIAAQLAEQHTENRGFGLTLVPLKKQVVGNIRVALLILLAAVGVVLAIACANVANLLLARAAARHKEIAIRAALGATRSRIIRQLIMESVLLALVGGTLGLFLAYWGVDLIVALSPADLPRKYDINIDGTVLGFALVVSVLTGVVFGLAPAFQATRLSLNEILKEGTRGSTGGLRGNRLRSLLVIAEVALALVLLIGAGLLIRTFARLLNVDPGFTARNVLTMNIALPESKYPKEEQRTTFFRQVRDRVTHLPGIESAGLISELPLSGYESLNGFLIEGMPEPASIAETPLAESRAVDHAYFRAMGIPLVAGRYFTEHDNEEAPKVALVNETFVRRFSPGEEVVGKRMKMGAFSLYSPWYTIVGVVEDVRHELESEPKPQMYCPHAQDSQSRSEFFLVAKTAGDARTYAAAIGNEIWAVDKDQPVTDIKTVGDYLAGSLARRRFNMILLGVFAAVALVLAAVGIYGVMSYSVTQRTHEIGVRVALGAQTRDVLKLVIRQGVKMAMIGVGIGLIGALALTRLMASLLFEVSTTDPVTFSAVALLLACVALLACWIPARRATKVDPMIALRYE